MCDFPYSTMVISKIAVVLKQMYNNNNLHTFCCPKNRRERFAVSFKTSEDHNCL